MVVFTGLVGVVAGFDTYAETIAVRESMCSDNWVIMGITPLQLSGIGGVTVSAARVRLPVRFRRYSKVVRVTTCTIPDILMPAGVSLLFGTATQRHMRAVVDMVNDRIEMRSEGLSINLETVVILTQRLASDPIKVLDLCVGSS